jgi:ligand-binding SRPBCC domain-containing protein
MHRLEFKSVFSAPITDVWEFFSSPENLGKITPSSMDFRIVTPVPAKIHPGLLIGYKVSPFPGMRVRWLTEITYTEEYRYFIDEQRMGPNRIWHHEHHFREIRGGVEMRDVLTYVLPLGFIGRIFDNLLVRKRIKMIFDYREKKIRELFHYT